MRSIPAVPNSAAIWVLAMMSTIPNSSIDLMSCFGTVPRAPITTGRMAVSTVHDGFSLLQMIDPDICQLSSSDYIEVNNNINDYKNAFSTRIISGMLCATVMSVWIVRSKYNSTSSFSTTSAGVCSYHLSEISNPWFLHNSQ